MAQSIVEMAKDLVMAMIQENLIASEDMQKELQKTHASLLGLKAQEEGEEGTGVPMEKAPDQVNWKKSIKKYTVECLVCGDTFKQLSVRHLSTHGLDQRSYRQKYGIPRTQPLSAKETTAMRKRVVQESRPWEKAPTYVKAHGPAGKEKTAAPAKGSKKKTAASSN